MKIFATIACTTWAILFNFGHALAAGAVQEADYKLGEQFKVTYISSSENLQYRINEDGKLIDLKMTTTPVRIEYDVRVSSVEADGIIFEWHQRPEVAHKIKSEWKTRKQPPPTGSTAVKTRLSLDANDMTLANKDALIAQAKERIESQLAKLPAARQQSLRSAAMAKLENLNEQAAITAFAPQSLVLASAYLAKEVYENRGGETNVADSVTGGESTVKLKVTKDQGDDRTSYKFQRVHQMILTGEAARQQLPKNLPAKTKAHLDKFLQDTITVQSDQSGDAIFGDGRPQKISVEQRTTSNPLGKEQYQEIKVELSFDYNAQQQPVDISFLCVVFRLALAQTEPPSSHPLLPFPL